MTRIAIVGGGPAGYEAALVAAQLGAEVTVVDRDGIGGACVLADCVPSKTLIATSESMTTIREAYDLGVRVPGGDGAAVVDLAGGQRAGQVPRPGAVRRHRGATGPRGHRGRSPALPRFVAPTQLAVRAYRIGSRSRRIGADADPHRDRRPPAGPRQAPSPTASGSSPGASSTTSTGCRSELIVIGSGVTGAEFASAYQGLGSAGHARLEPRPGAARPGRRRRDAARVGASPREGMTVLKRSRAAGVTRTSDGVLVTLEDGRTVEGSHALVAVGSIPNTAGLGLEDGRA